MHSPTPKEYFGPGVTGRYRIKRDPMRSAGLRIVMGPFMVYNADNIGPVAR